MQKTEMAPGVQMVYIECGEESREKKQNVQIIFFFKKRLFKLVFLFTAVEKKIVFYSFFFFLNVKHDGMT